MEVLSGIHGVDFDGIVWAYLVKHGRRFTLIDSGIAGRLELIEAAALSAGGKLTDIAQILLTHCHEDHAGNVAELQRVTSARTLAHALDVPVVRGEAKVPPPVLVSEAERAIHGPIAAKMPPAPPAHVDVELAEGDMIPLSDDAATVIHTPGHTPGSISFLLPERGVLFTGDAVAALGSGPVLGFFNANPDEARRSFAKLSLLTFDTAFYGHGPATVTSADLAFRHAVAPRD